MIIKRMDSRKEDIEELSSLLKEELTANQRFLIERELRGMKNGSLGEEDAAYYIDFYYEKSNNWAVIHDLRLEHENLVAQIDHLLINRFFDIYVMESKNYSFGIKINEIGEFVAFYGKKPIGIESPIEQNGRHIHALDKFLRSHDFLPKRMGITIRPRFHNWILMSPKCVITRPPEKKFDTSGVIKADTLATKIDEAVDKAPISDIATIGKICASATIEDFAKKLVSFHRPMKIDFRAKFGLPPKQVLPSEPDPPSAEEPQSTVSTPKRYCFSCKKAISEKVAKFCWQNKSKFGGKAYCFNCQKEVASPGTPKLSSKESLAAAAESRSSQRRPYLQ